MERNEKVNAIIEWFEDNVTFYLDGNMVLHLHGSALVTHLLDLFYRGLSLAEEQEL